ncbi:hypothetical protein [Spirosoma endbachense]|uniref:Uncharacterized protein n=1 Tax=Spirosoma endbachense TaxID=2666025 RepID=A0A6P1WAW4_9BACT|nr:hypothetical protein [Spirosoma endbachense]QHW01031.1 hypothetical protein GJR95_41040 [Spirosoma endbachense]
MKKSTAFWIRIVGGGAIAILLGWLAVAPRFESRFITLKKFVTTGDIGRLTSEENVLFQELVLRAVQAANIKDSIVINGLPTETSLHFYLTDSRSQKFTGCFTGNAVYDPELDAVFIDRSLFRPKELDSFGGVSIFPFWRNRDFAFTQTFLTLILLHELGHRTLHRSLSPFFDGNLFSNSRDKELEADVYSLEAFKKGYSQGLFSDSDILGEFSGATGIKDKLNSDEALSAALLFSASQMSTTLLFTRGSTSSLYEDESHPSFGFRINRIADILARQESRNPTLNKYIAYFRSKLKRVDSLRYLGFTELHSEKAIRGIAFDENGLTLVDKSWNVIHVPNEDLGKNLKSITLSPYILGRIPIQDTTDNLCEIWSLKNGGVFLLSCKHHLFSVHKRKFKTEPYLNSRLDSTLADIFSSDQPAPLIIRNNFPTFSVIRNHKTIHTERWANVLGNAPASSPEEQLTTREITIIDDISFVPVYGDHGLIGTLIISVTPAFNVKFVKLNTEGDIDRTGELAICKEGNRIRYFLAGKVDVHTKVTVWELDLLHAPKEKATYSPLLDALSTLKISAQNSLVYIRDIKSTGGKYIFISLMGDGVLLYDIHSNSIKPVFHTVAIEPTIITSRQGTVAFTAENSYKVFVMPLGNN